MTISDMPLAESGTAEVRRASATRCLRGCVRWTTPPAAVTMPGDPALELGDRLALPTADAAPETLVTHLVWKFRGEMTLKGVGKTPTWRALPPTPTPSCAACKSRPARTKSLLQLHQRLRHKSEGQRQGDQRRELDFCYHAGYLGHVFWRRCC